MKELIVIAIFLLFSGSLISIAITLSRSSNLIKYIKHNYPAEYQRLNWNTKKSTMEGFYENEVLPYIKSQQYLELNDEKLIKLAQKAENKWLDRATLFFTCTLVLVVVLGSVSGVLHA